VKEKVGRHVKLSVFSWDHDFKVLNVAPSLLILGLDFISRTRMVLYMDVREFYFSFAPEHRSKFQKGNVQLSGMNPTMSDYCSQLLTEISWMDNLASASPGTGLSDKWLGKFLDLFSGKIGTTRNTCYEIELVDTVPVRSTPYRLAPPKAAILKMHVKNLLIQGIIRPSKSPYASPAFLVPKSDGTYRMVVDFSKVNNNIKFDSYPMPTIDEAFQQFSGASVFSVLD
jgi:hypothetical protein